MNQHYLQSLACALLLSAASACADVIQLPARTPPVARMPRVALPREAPPPGFGRLVIDVEGESLSVSVFPTGARLPPLALSDPRLLCDTPCVRDLPLGNYDVYFHKPSNARDDVVTIEVGRALTVLREAPGKHHAAAGFQPLPDLIGTVGAVLAFSSIGVTSSNGTALLSPTLLSLGAAMFVFGLVTHQYAAEEQADAHTHFVRPLPQWSTPQDAHQPVANVEFER